MSRSVNLLALEVPLVPRPSAIAQREDRAWVRHLALVCARLSIRADGTGRGAEEDGAHLGDSSTEVIPVAARDRWGGFV